MWLANNKSADQSAHPRSLISAFIIHILLSTIVNEYRFSICPFVDVRSYFLIKVITCWHANNKSADHSVHPRSLISAFIIHILLSTIVNEYFWPTSYIYFTLSHSEWSSLCMLRVEIYPDYKE